MNFGGPIDLTPFGGLVRGIGLLYWAIALGATGLALWLPKRWIVRLPLAALVLAGFIYPMAIRVNEMKQAQDARRARLDESMALFEERCKTAGERIGRAVENVEGVVWMKWREPISNADNFADQFKLNDPYGQDCGAEHCVTQLLRVTKGADLNPQLAKQHNVGYRFVETVDPKDGVRYRYTGVIKLRAIWTEEAIARLRSSGRDIEPYDYEFVGERVVIDKFSARYGITWDDISTREDREHWIAGGSLKVIDLQSNEGIAERRGYMVDRGQGSQAGGRSPWLFAIDIACPAFRARGDGSGSSRSYLSDRQAMLQWEMVRNLGNVEGPISAGPGVQGMHFRDVASTVEIDIGLTNGSVIKSQTVFGDGEANNLAGDRLADHLYGGAGADTLRGLGGADWLEGQSGADRLEGGAGNDTLLGGAGDDILEGGADNDLLRGGAQVDTYRFSGAFGADVIEDSGGDGSIVVEGLGTLNGQGLRQTSATTWRSEDGSVTYARTDGNLVIRVAGTQASGSLVVRDWSEGRLGINLSTTEAPPVTTTPLTGDTIKLTNDAGTRYLFDSAGNFRSGGVRAGEADVILGGAAAEVIRGLGGNDGLSGGGGDDSIEGGAGDDLLFGERVTDIYQLTAGSGSILIDGTWRSADGCTNAANDSMLMQWEAA